MADEIPSKIVGEIAFVGRGGGLVKALGGFKKGHHTIPDAANDVTNAFLGKICAAELADEAETLFQAVRAGFGYKRKDLSLSLGSPLAVLAAKDFTVEIAYELEVAAPERYTTTTTLRALRDARLARSDAMASVFAARFSEIAFALKRGAQVEAVIDAIEELEEDQRLSVHYPSDCSECEIRVEGVDAHVRCTGMSLDMVFPRPGAPGELIEAFAEVRAAFGISPELAGLIG